MSWEEFLNDIFSVLNFTVFRNERIIADVNYLISHKRNFSESHRYIKTINNRDNSKVKEYVFKQLIMFIGRLWTVL